MFELKLGQLKSIFTPEATKFSFSIHASEHIILCWNLQKYFCDFKPKIDPEDTSQNKISLCTYAYKYLQNSDICTTWWFKLTKW